MKLKCANRRMAYDAVRWRKLNVVSSSEDLLIWRLEHAAHTISQTEFIHDFIGILSSRVTSNNPK